MKIKFVIPLLIFLPVFSFAQAPVELLLKYYVAHFETVYGFKYYLNDPDRDYYQEVWKAGLMEPEYVELGYRVNKYPVEFSGTTFYTIEDLSTHPTPYKVAISKDSIYKVNGFYEKAKEGEEVYFVNHRDSIIFDLDGFENLPDSGKYKIVTAIVELAGLEESLWRINILDLEYNFENDTLNFEARASVKQYYSQPEVMYWVKGKSARGKPLIISKEELVDK